MDSRNGPVIQTLLNELQRETEKITRAQGRIVEIKEELADLGVPFAGAEDDQRWRGFQEVLASFFKREGE